MDEPSTIEGNEMSPPRRSVRIRTNIPVTLIWHEDLERKHELTHTVSISRFGCLLRSHHDFPLGSTLRIECGYRFILGSVIYCLRDQSTKTSELGIAFYEDGSVLWGTNIPD